MSKRWLDFNVLAELREARPTQSIVVTTLAACAEAIQITTTNFAFQAAGAAPSPIARNVFFAQGSDGDSSEKRTVTVGGAGAAMTPEPVSANGRMRRRAIASRPRRRQVEGEVAGVAPPGRRSRAAPHVLSAGHPAGVLVRR